jgi:hypothetical protein
MAGSIILRISAITIITDTIVLIIIVIIGMARDITMFGIILTTTTIIRAVMIITADGLIFILMIMAIANLRDGIIKRPS